MIYEMKGWFEMKKLAKIEFTYEDGSVDQILDQRACLLFQSRCNSNGLVSGMGEFITSKESGEQSNDESVS